MTKNFKKFQKWGLTGTYNCVILCIFNQYVFLTQKAMDYLNMDYLKFVKAEEIK